MGTGDWINLGICIATMAAVTLGLIQFWLTRSEEKAIRLQDREHELATKLQAQEKRRIDNLFTAFGAALKQVQDIQKQNNKDFQEFSLEIARYRNELQTERAVAKIETDHIKETLSEVREELKSVVKYLGEGKFRVSGKKF